MGPPNFNGFLLENGNLEAEAHGEIFVGRNDQPGHSLLVK